jgi:hypothetical protein
MCHFTIPRETRPALKEKMKDKSQLPSCSNYFIYSFLMNVRLDFEVEFVRKIIGPHCYGKIDFTENCLWEKYKNPNITQLHLKQFLLSSQTKI